MFGPVQSPFYVIRFCNEESFKNTGLNIGDTVYYAPDFLHVTKFVFVEQLKKQVFSKSFPALFYFIKFFNPFPCLASLFCYLFNYYFNYYYHLI